MGVSGIVDSIADIMSRYT